MPDMKAQSGPSFLFVTNKDMNQQVMQLARRLKEHKSIDRMDYVVCINRGGMYVARMLSDILKLPVLALGVRSYKGVNDRTELELFQDISVTLEGKHVLLIDEICDSGETFAFVESHLKDKGCLDVISCCLYTKPQSRYIPTYGGVTTTQWVVFPYEFRETYEAIQPFIESNEDLKRRMRKYMFDSGMIEDDLQLLMD